MPGDRAGTTKDFWDKAQVTAIALSAAALPVVIAIIGNSFSASTKEKEIRLKTVEIAVNVLSQDPKTNTALPQLREWAINVVDSYSGIPLSALAREELLKNPLPSKESAKVIELLSSGFEGRGGGVFLESSVDGYKLLQGDADITEHVKYVSPRTPLIAREGIYNFSVIMGDRRFDIGVPVKSGQLTKIVIEKTRVYSEGPLAPGVVIKD